MIKAKIFGFFVAFSLVGGQALASSNAEHPKSVHWSFDGVFGHYEPDSLQRGLQVYKEVCSACHGLRLVAFRTLTDLGYSAPEIKAFAAQYEVQNEEPNDDGEMFKRPALPSDHFVSPFPNEQAARAANGGALPPDLSLITKAREGGANYVYSILTGYTTPPAGLEKSDTQYYNPYFSGHLIGMPPPLSEGAVTFADGTKATVDQMAHDVSSFLTWASSPKLENQKSTGLKVMLFLIVLTGMLIAVKKKIWSDVH